MRRSYAEGHEELSSGSHTSLLSTPKFDTETDWLISGFPGLSQEGPFPGPFIQGCITNEINAVDTGAKI